TDWELIFNMLGEKATTDITRTRDAQGFEENKQSAKRGGQIAYNARKELEQEIGKSVISKDNFLSLTERKKLENKKKNDKK
ncbi:phage antirepressor protein, partial [Candidatus Woesearchaeota archaeon]|nr:phage antirepressor protein [Candidatus Woesearchaeota archaeon]